MSLMSAGEMLRRLDAGEILLSDGAMGTELLHLGVLADDLLRTNLGMPEEVLEIHRNYVNAGADMLTSNTFGLREGTDWANSLRAGISLAVTAAREADRPVGVWMSLAANIVPLEIDGLLFLKESVLQWPDTVLIETCTSLPEAVRAVEALKKLNLALIAVTCHFTHEGIMLDGTSPEAAANVLMDAGATIVGANCGDDPESFVSVAERMRTQQREGKYWLFQPGAGLPVRDANNQLHYPTTPESFASTMQEIGTARTILGGCCGTTPAHIQALYHLLHQQ